MPISVQFSNSNGQVSDVIRVLRTSDKSLNYTVASYTSHNMADNVLSVVAVKDNTHIKIWKRDGNDLNKIHDVTLNSLQTFTKRDAGAAAEPADFTGLIIKADKPVNVIGGCLCAKIPANSKHCGMVMMNYPSTDNYGKLHYLYPIGEISQWVNEVECNTFTSHVSGRGPGIRAVFLRVCLSMCL